MNAKKIQQIKSLQTWTKTHFHGNTKKVGLLTIDELKTIVEKKRKREILKCFELFKTDAQKVKELINWSIKCKGTNYFKVLIEGNTGIYYASEIYQHSDYNKTRMFDKNEKTLKLMNLFNTIVNK